MTKLIFQTLTGVLSIHRDCLLLLALGATLAGCAPDASEVQHRGVGEVSSGVPAADTAHGEQGASPGGEVRGPQQPAQHTNRLAGETSPYLLLHAHNPVDWYPWGPEALERARQEDKLIFLSVGYSSCYWCHVMERESFMDDEIAAFLNEHFVCIKVDREERPDVDSIYMAAVQILTRRGGWPMSMFLTPDAEPFFGGTYFPARDGDRRGSPGFLTIVQRIHETWVEKAADVRTDAGRLTEFVRRHLAGRPTAETVDLNVELLQQVTDALAESYDAAHGGFGFHPADPQRPKFPEPSNLVFLLDRAMKTQDAQAREMLEASLEKMASGGIRDHLGGGFHRYSVDRYWKIPHFEKMLYDNGQLASVYSRAYGLTGREDFRRVVVELIAWLEREMLADGGPFYTALDAETDAEEGKFYRWERDELEHLLADDEWQLLAPLYGLDGAPNFEHEYYVPQLAGPLAESVREGETETELDVRLAPLRARLLDARDQRDRPLTDTKILTAWNGLMIRGLADAGREFDEPRYVQLAARAADFLWEELRTEDGRLLRTYGEGEAKLNGYLNDYAFFVDGLIALYRASDDRRWLDRADQLTEKQIELFWDERGGFYFTSDDHETLIARTKNPIDGAIPAGNSVVAENLVYLAGALDRPEYLDLARQTIQSVAGLLSASPSAIPRMAVAISELLDVDAESSSR